MERSTIVLATIILAALSVRAVGVVEHAVSIIAADPAGGGFRVEPVPMLDPNRDWYKPYVATSLLVPSNRATFAEFQRKFIDMSTMLSRLRKTKSMDRWILPMQHLRIKPEVWNLVDVWMDTSDQGALAFRVDNLYLSGFANATGHWHTFSDVTDIPDAIPLSFSSSYTDLFDAAENLVQLELGERALDDAFQVVLHYYPGAVDDEIIKRALATIIVMVCEGARFSCIGDAILQGWETGVHLTREQAKLIVNWSTVSCAIILCEQDGGNKWDSREAQKLALDCRIVNPQQAIDAVSFLIYPAAGVCSRDFSL